MGEEISPTLISRYETQIGNTQDKLNVMQQTGIDLYNTSITGGVSMAIRSQADNEHIPCMVEEDKEMNTVVRRLTPMECERLQGYPDHWTEIGEWIDSKGKKHKDADSPRYKALGNSIALPFWEWMAERMLSHIEHEHPTMASLFDGIGGFPLVYSRHGAEPVWASEIEEFPIAVTKIRFPDSEVINEQ